MCYKYKKLEESYSYTEYNQIENKARGGGENKQTQKQPETNDSLFTEKQRYCVSRALIRHNAW